MATTQPISLPVRHSKKHFEKLNKNPQASAKSVGLVYVSDTSPGYTRKRSGKAFSYYAPDGNLCKDKNALRRIKSLGIPPAWTNVWICADEKGHLQATGTDGKGRKQYRYHADWSQVRSTTKYHRIERFANQLPVLRERLENDMAANKLTYHKVVALAVRIIELTGIRVGNEAYKRMYGSFGLTTLEDDNIEASASKVTFSFKGKKGIYHRIPIRNSRLARLVQRCKDIPGKELFQYYDEEKNAHCITSTDVNTYLHETVGDGFTAKDFRTWIGSLTAFCEFKKTGDFETQTEAKQNIRQCLEAVAKRLGNTVTVCKKYYVHPALIRAYEEHKLFKYMEDVDVCAENPLGIDALSPIEEQLCKLLKDYN
ncbi:DNA topoisomerase IB [Runella sp.]|uniref:DNA topoisomerase IB n=1 Tax=Runella sp. TaxID=1960881 RepID=UPI003D09AFC3